MADNGNLKVVASTPNTIRAIRNAASLRRDKTTPPLAGNIHRKSQLAYKGFFKVVDASTAASGETPAVAKVKIVDGLNEDATNCFSGYINKIKKDISET